MSVVAASLENLDPKNRTRYGVWSVERGRPLSDSLPWAEDVLNLVGAYQGELLARAEPDCFHCGTLASNAARARGAMACLEAAAKEHGVTFAAKSGTRKLWRDWSVWMDRWEARSKALDEHLANRHPKAKPATALDYMNALDAEGA